MERNQENGQLFLLLNEMLQLLKTRRELLLVLILFTIARWSALSYPFYIDESWSYAPGVALMYQHGPSLMPNAIDLFYSRGHPLLFYASAAMWMKAFGASHFAQHAFALFLSLLTIVATHEIAYRLFNKTTANFALLIAPLQVMFFVQSAMLLPEIMITLLVILALYFFALQKHLFTFLACSALYLTKESGMVMGLALGIVSFLGLFAKGVPIKNKLAPLVALACSGICIGIFYLLQKKLNGWYLFPEHMGMIKWDWPTIWKKIQFSLEVLFVHDYRFRLFQLLLVLAAIVAVYTKDIRFMTPLVPGYLIYAIIENRFSWMPRQALLALFFVSLLYAAWQMINLADIKQSATRRFVYAATIFTICYLLFSGINFFTARYLCCVLFIVIILTAAWLNTYLKQLYAAVHYAALACVALCGYYGLKYDTGLTDVNRGAYDAMKVQQDVIKWCETNQLYTKAISAPYVQREHLQKPLTGFRNSAQQFTSVTYEPTGTTDFAIYDNIEPDSNYFRIKINSAFKLTYRTTSGEAWSEIYERIK